MKMRRLFSAFAIALSLLPAAAWAAPEKYYVPPTQFSAAFQVMDLGFSNVFGMFRNATGAFVFDPEAKTISHVRLAMDATSMMAANPSASGDLHALFSVRQYPEISFMATAPATFKDGKAEIKGTLTVHGQSKPATFEGTLNNVGNSPRGGGMWSSEGAAVGISLRGSFKRADFGMGDPPEVPGRFGDSINLMLEMQAIQQ